MWTLIWIVWQVDLNQDLPTKLTITWDGAMARFMVLEKRRDGCRRRIVRNRLPTENKLVDFPLMVIVFQYWCAISKLYRMNEIFCSRQLVLWSPEQYCLIWIMLLTLQSFTKVKEQYYRKLALWRNLRANWVSKRKYRCAFVFILLTPKFYILSRPWYFSCYRPY